MHDLFCTGKVMKGQFSFDLTTLLSSLVTPPL